MQSEIKSVKKSSAKRPRDDDGEDVAQEDVPVAAAELVVVEVSLRSLPLGWVGADGVHVQTLDDLRVDDGEEEKKEKEEEDDDGLGSIGMGDVLYHLVPAVAVVRGKQTWLLPLACQPFDYRVTVPGFSADEVDAEDFSGAYGHDPVTSPEVMATLRSGPGTVVPVHKHLRAGRGHAPTTLPVVFNAEWEDVKTRYVAEYSRRLQALAAAGTPAPSFTEKVCPGSRPLLLDLQLHWATRDVSGSSAEQDSVFEIFRKNRVAWHDVSLPGLRSVAKHLQLMQTPVATATASVPAGGAGSGSGGAPVVPCTLSVRL